MKKEELGTADNIFDFAFQFENKTLHAQAEKYVKAGYHIYLVTIKGDDRAFIIKRQYIEGVDGFAPDNSDGLGDPLLKSAICGGISLADPL